jgi:hypothetical protein
MKKDRLAAWHVRKNIKAKEVHLMLRKQQKRAAQGKQFVLFFSNGLELGDTASKEGIYME